MRIGKTIYLDHHATTPVDEAVIAQMTPYFSKSFGNPHSSDHSLGWEASLAVEDAASAVAGLIGADKDEVIFTSGATESNNLALLGLGRGASTGDRKRILVSAIEHKCVVAACRALRDQLGYTIEVIPVDVSGRVIVSALEDALKEDVLAVSVMAVNNEVGTIQDLRRISNAIATVGAIFHCDGAQAPIAMDVRAIAQHVDLLSLSAHKMYGPKGIGALYIRRELQNQIEPLIYGGGQQSGLRSGTVPVPLCVGMGAAAKILTTAEADEKRTVLRQRRDAFLEKLRRLPWPLTVNGSTDQCRHPGNANIRFTGFSAQEILASLQPRLAASTGSACTSGIPEPSHVLKALGLSGFEAEASIRFGLGFGTTDEDIEEAVQLIEQTLANLSKAGFSEC